MCSNNLKLPIRAAPYRHQREAAAFALDKLVNGGGAALLMEMGTGKTLTTIAIVGRLWQEKRVHHLLVVAPLSILGVWEDEFRKFADYDYCPSDEYLSDAGLQVARQEPRTGGRGSTAEGSVCGCVNMARKN